MGLLNSLAGGIGAKFKNSLGVGDVSAVLTGDKKSISANFNQLLKKEVDKTTVRSELRQLYDIGLQEEIVFPPDLDDEHYLIFNIINKEKSGIGEQSVSKRTTTIVLPLPSNINPQYAAEYGESNLGYLGKMATSPTEQSLTNVAKNMANELGQSDLAQFLGQVTGFVDTPTDTFNQKGSNQAKAFGVSAILTSVASMGLGGLGGAITAVGTADGIVQGILKSERKAFNPHKAILFEGVGFRTFSFSYSFMARNLDESNKIRNLISVFKKHMYPTVSASDFFFNYPDEFQLEFSTSVQPYMFKFKPCVLESLDVKYNGEGTQKFFDVTGAPVSVDITMNFKEIELLTSDDFVDSEDSY